MQKSQNSPSISRSDVYIHLGSYKQPARQACKVDILTAICEPIV
jgi:hypothetical protein